VNSKICRTCLIEKNIDCFSIERKKIKGKLYEYLKTRCKECDKEYLAKYHSLNKDRNNDKKKAYRAENKEKISEQRKAKYQLNKDFILARCREKRKSPQYKTRVNEYHRNRRETDPLFKLQITLRNRIRKILNGWSKSASSEVLIGCSWEELKSHLESLFQEGMTWENHGNKGWHIDHIIPLSSGKTLKEIEELCHYTNLQPLWWHENLSKGSKL